MRYKAWDMHAAGSWLLGAGFVDIQVLPRMKILWLITPMPKVNLCSWMALSAVVLVTSLPARAQASSCDAYGDGRKVGTYSCTVRRDAGGRITFMQWQDGTASTSLGGWRRVNADCFAASEEPRYWMCAR